MTNKFLAVKKERDNLSRENKELQNEILILQSNIRQMIPGFSSNTSSPFPMFNELNSKMQKFFKIDCVDIFFDLLSPELNMEGIVFFYRKCFAMISDITTLYFDPVDRLLKHTLCIDELWTPIDNVLRKSYQSNYRKIFSQVAQEKSYIDIMRYIQDNLKLQEDDTTIANNMIIDFLKKCAEIFFFCHTSDPPIVFDISTIGQKVFFNQSKFESMDGFIPLKKESLIILPACYKSSISIDSQIIKAYVLPLDYEFP